MQSLKSSSTNLTMQMWATKTVTFPIFIEQIGLKKFLLERPLGVKKDRDLLLCYLKLKDDMQELVNEKWAYEIIFKDNPGVRNKEQDVVVFGRDLGNKDVEVEQDYSVKTFNLIRNIWNVWYNLFKALIGWKGNPNNAWWLWLCENTKG